MFYSKTLFGLKATGEALSHRLQVMAITLLVLMSMQLVVASCTPEPAPYAARVLINR